MSESQWPPGVVHVLMAILPPPQSGNATDVCMCVHIIVVLWVFNGLLFSVPTLIECDIATVSPFIKVSVCGG